MAADFNKPTITGDAYVDVLGEIRAQFEVVSTMSYGDALNTKVGAVQFLDGSLQKWDGASFNVVPVSITGGGTGASTAAGARTALNVNEKGTLGAQVRSNAESDALYVPQSRTISTAGALNGGNSLDSNISLTVDSATTGQQGVVQLFNGVNSSSVTLALTAAQGQYLNQQRQLIYNLFSQLYFSFKADWNGSSYSVTDVTGDQGYWGIQTSNVTKIGTGNIQVAIPAAVSNYTVQAIAVSSSLGINVSVGNITSSSFQVYCRRIDTNALIDTDVFITVTQANTLG